MRAAIAGTGFVGAIHANAIRAAGGVITGVMASTPARSAEAARRFGAGGAYESAEAIVADPDVDVVHVCTPNHLHEDLAALALQAGKHVVCEKPLAIDGPSAQRLADLAAETQACAAVPFVYRFYPTAREARRRVAGGDSGDVHLIHGTYLQDWLLTPDDDNWRVDAALGGASRTFADIGSHWCDLAEFITGQRIVRLNARTTTAIPVRREDAARAAFAPGSDNGTSRAVTTEDAATMQFETDRGALGSMIVSQISAGRKNRLWIEVDASAEAVVFDQEDAESLWVGRREESVIIRRDPNALAAPAARFATLPAGHPQGYQDCFNLFVADAYEAARSGEAPDGLPVFADGLRAARITEAVLASAASQAWVEIAAMEVRA
jgi:predicted dehydrogenase